MTNKDKLDNEKLLNHLKEIKDLLKIILENNNFEKNPNHNLKIIVYTIEKSIHQFLKIENLEDLLEQEKEIKRCITDATSLFYFYFLDSNMIDKNQLLESNFFKTKINKVKEKTTKQAAEISSQITEITQLKEKLKKIELNYKKNKKIEEEFSLLEEKVLDLENKYQKIKNTLKKTRVIQKTLKIENSELKKIIKILKENEKEIKEVKITNHKKEKKIVANNVKLKVDVNRKTERAIEKNKTNEDNRKNN